MVPPIVAGDGRQLGRVIQNLLANADRHARSEIRVALRRDGDLVTLSIDDDGQGVPTTERERIFNRFTRLDEGRIRDVRGSGLGLAIVREVAQAHGGTSTAGVSPLGGARFTVEILTPTTR